MDKKGIVFAFSLIFFILIIHSLAFSAEEVKFDAESLRFSFSSGFLVGRGNVVFSFKNLRLYADYAEIDVKEKNILAKGNVRIFIFGEKGKVEEIKGKAAYYDWDLEYFFIDDMRVDISGGKLRGILHLKGDVLEYRKFNKERKIKILCGQLTTCKGDHPAYYFEAKRIMIIPGKRIYAWNVSWYEGKSKVVTFPYFIIFLDRQYQLPYIPKVGYSKSDGWFIKNTFNYFVDPYSWGTVYLDLYSKKGIGYGIRHEWEKKDYDIALSLYYFKYKEDKDRDFKTELTLSDWKVGNFSGNLKLSYTTQGDLESATKKLYGQLTLKGDKKFPLNLKLSYTGSGENTSDTEKIEGEITYKDKLFNKTVDTNLKLKYVNSVSSGSATPNLTGNLKLSYKKHAFNYSYKGSGEKFKDNTQKFMYTYNHTFSKELKDRLTLYYEIKNKEEYENPDTYAKAENTITYKDLSLFVSKYFDTDGNLFTDDSNFNFVERLPEIKYAPSIKKLGKTGLKYKYTLIAGNYYEVGENFNAQRYGAKLDLSGDIKFSRKFGVSYLIYGEDYLYSTGDSQYSYGGELKVRANIGPKTIMEATFKQKDVKGETPFAFDEISPYKSLSLSVKSREDMLKLSLSGGYDYLSKKYKKVVGTLVYEPTDIFRGSFKFGYDLNTGKWTKLTGSIKVKFGNNWRIDYSAALSADTMKITNNKVILTYSLPCEREVSLAYDQKKEEYWLEYNILAFPSPLISFGSGK